MFYSLLGRAVWFALKFFLRRKLGRASVPKPLLAGGTVAIAIAVAVAVLRSRSSDSS